MGILLTENGKLAAAVTVPIPSDIPVTGDGVMLLASGAADTAPAQDAETISPDLSRVMIEPLVVPPPPKVISETFIIPSKKPAMTDIKPAVVVEPARRTALRPDANGLVILARNTSSSAVDEARQTRNPWGVRVAARDSMVEYKLALDGLVFGSRGGGTALINGVPVRIGERLIGPFVLAEINTRAGEVTMEYDGTFFILTEGRNTEVRIPKF